VGIGHDHEGTAEHGAKDGVPPCPVQPAVAVARVSSSVPNV
jgi:hypothetical protein